MKLTLLAQLLEAEESVETVKAIRMMKFSLRNGENSLGVDLANTKCEYYAIGWFMFIGKPNSLKVGSAYRFENADKPGFRAESNMKLGTFGAKVVKVLSTLPEAIAHLKTLRAPAVVIDPALLKGAKPAAPKEKDAEPTEIEDGFYVLGYWGNPYRSNDKEYFWAGAFRERKNALAFGKRKQEKGQPKNFRDWVKGEVKIIRGQDKFVAAAKKAGLNPNVSDVSWFDE